MSTGIRVEGQSAPSQDQILTPEALDFIARLQREIGPAREDLLARRSRRLEDLSHGIGLGFLEDTAAVRAARWQVAPSPPDLTDRRVEITGPTTRKMTINALNSGANVWLADFEDANTPLWPNMIEGQLNLKDARPQVWQWIHGDVILDDGPLVTKDVVERMIDEELGKIRELVGDSFDTARYGQAVALFTEVALADSFAEFLTLPAYERMP